MKLFLSPIVHFKTGLRRSNPEKKCKRYIKEFELFCVHQNTNAALPATPFRRDRQQAQEGARHQPRAGRSYGRAAPEGVLGQPEAGHLPPRDQAAPGLSVLVEVQHVEPAPPDGKDQQGDRALRLRRVPRDRPRPAHHERRAPLRSMPVLPVLGGAPAQVPHPV